MEGKEKTHHKIECHLLNPNDLETKMILNIANLSISTNKWSLRNKDNTENVSHLSVSHTIFKSRGKDGCLIAKYLSIYSLK
jgi:hypothetical protein